MFGDGIRGAAQQTDRTAPRGEKGGAAQRGDPVCAGAFRGKGACAFDGFACAGKGRGAAQDQRPAGFGVYQNRVVDYAGAELVSYYLYLFWLFINFRVLSYFLFLFS